MSQTIVQNATISNTERKLSLKERFVKYITSKETAEICNSALAAMNGGRYIPLDK